MSIGATIVLRMMRSANVPPFRTCASFLTMNRVSLIAVTMLTVAASRLRKDTRWRRRLMVCRMAALPITAMSRPVPGAILAESTRLVRLPHAALPAGTAERRLAA